MISKDLRTIRVARRYWRMLAPKWAHDPLSGAGAALRGGRFNPPGIPALYMSEEFATAIAEYQQDLGIRPGTLCAYDVTASRIIDLTNADIQRALGLKPADLRAPWKWEAFVKKTRPTTWALAEKLIAEKYSGIRVPSAQAQGYNLVLWRWNVKGGAKVKALDPLRDLPANQMSWRGEQK